jgi:uncharacterized protein (TIGR03663 family)
MSATDAGADDPGGTGGPGGRGRGRGGSYLRRVEALDEVPLVGRLDDLTRGVLVTVLVGLVLRVVGLGGRVAHFDEGRVAYFTEYLVRTGAFEYRPIIHGPLLQHVNSVTFAALGSTDFAARLFVALVGAGLPLTALLFRERLRETEVLALALFLALNPVLLYYSRFSRSTVLVAACMFAAFGLFVRLLETERPAYLYAGVAAAGLGFGAKENAVLYVLCWLGAGALVADRALFGPRGYDGGLDRLRTLAGRLRRRYGRETVLRGLSHGVLAAGLLALVVGFLYAPRGDGSPVTVGGEAVGLYGLVAHPGVVGELVSATVDDVSKVAYWFGQAGSEGGQSASVSAVVGQFLDFFAQTLETYALYAAPLAAFGVLGFVYERYVRSEPRPFVMFAGYWAGASAIGYPVGTDIYGAWITVNVLVPLAIPAAVAAAALYRTGVDSFAADDRTAVGLVVLVFALVATQTAVAGTTGVYLDADEAEGMTQYAQPSDGTRVALSAAQDAAGAGGPDLLLYGNYFVDDEEDFAGLGDDDITVPLYPQCGKFYPSLSLPWYLYKDDIETVCAVNATAFENRFGGETRPPPVILARASAAPGLDARLEGYERSEFFLRTAAGDRKRTVVFVRR